MELNSINENIELNNIINNLDLNENNEEIDINIIEDNLEVVAETGEYLETEFNVFPMTSETDPIFLSSPAHNITNSDIENWNSKQERLIAGDNIIIENNVISSTATGGTGNFDELDNRPKYNNNLMNHLTNIPLVPTKTSDLANDSGYIKNTVNNLTNYTKTSDLGDLATLDNVNYSTQVTNKPTIPTKTSDLTNDSDFANKTFVNSSIATNTAYYISNNGQPFNSLAELEAYSGTITNNDYAFVKGTDSEGNTIYTRYKYSSQSTSWSEEYVLNNSSFTAEQWAAINSGLNSHSLDSYATTEQLGTKQNTLVSGENIKTINNQSILGEGNIEIQGSEGSGDTLPIGAIVDYDGSTVPEGYEIVEDSKTILSKYLSSTASGDNSINWQCLGNLYLDLPAGTWLVIGQFKVITTGNGNANTRICLSNTMTPTGSNKYAFANFNGMPTTATQLSSIITLTETTRVYMLSMYAYSGYNLSIQMQYDSGNTYDGVQPYIKAIKL